MRLGYNSKGYIKKIFSKIKCEGSNLPITRQHDFGVRAGVGSRAHNIGHSRCAFWIDSSQVAFEISRVVDAGKGKRFRRQGGLQIILESGADDDAECARFSGSTSEENGDVRAILARFEFFDERCCESGDCNENEGEEFFREHRES